MKTLNDLDLIWNQFEKAAQREAEAMLRADVDKLYVLSDDPLLAHSTANLYAREATLLGLLKKGGAPAIA
jgi:hypothetical protein